MHKYTKEEWDMFRQMTFNPNGRRVYRKVPHWISTSNNEEILVGLAEAMADYQNVEPNSAAKEDMVNDVTRFYLTLLDVLFFMPAEQLPLHQNDPAHIAEAVKWRYQLGR